MGGHLTGAGERLPADAFGVILIGASGTGKSSSAAELQSLGIVQVDPTFTTRGLRSSETDQPPCDHVFISPEEFDELREDYFIATKSLYGFQYGVPPLRQPPGERVPLMVLKPDFIKPVLDHFPNLRIYQIEASLATVLQRMHARGQDKADITGRMNKHSLETSIGRRLADCIFKNEGSLSHTVRRLAEQIQADRASHPVTDLVA